MLLEFRPSFKFATLVVFAEIFQVTYMCIWTGTSDSKKNIIQLYYSMVWMNTDLFIFHVFDTFFKNGYFDTGCFMFETILISGSAGSAV